MRSRLWWAAFVIVLVFAFKAIGEFYPVSSFPMYARLSPSAEVLRLETGDGALVPLHTAFGRRESRCKKIWKSKLREICNPKGRDSADATPQEEREAGEYVLGILLTEGSAARREEALKGVKALRLIATEISVGEAKELLEEDRVVAEVTL